MINILHAVSCVALLAAAFRWQFARPAHGDARRFLFPFILAAAVLGCLSVAPWALELFAARYSGRLYEMEAMSFRFSGPYWWVYAAGFILPLLPVSGLFPAFGKRPLLMAVMALLALIPISFTPAVILIGRLFNRT